MKTISVLLVGFSFLFSSFSLLAQPTSNSTNPLLAIGIRVSPYYGLSAKYYMPNQTGVIEAIVSTRDDGASFTGLYEAQTDNILIENLKAFGGIGAHMNIYKNPNSSFWNWTSVDTGKPLGENHYFNAGIDLMIGLEYIIPELPFNVSVDWKPALNMVGAQGISTNQFAVSVRFVVFR